MGLIVNGRELLNVCLRIALRGGKGRVAEQLLNGAQVCTIGQKVSGKRVAQRVRVKVPIDVGEPRVFPHDRVDGARFQPPPQGFRKSACGACSGRPFRWGRERIWLRTGQ